jgi:adenine-specific DNA-methyltransferase
MTAAAPETRSEDIIAGNINQLKTLFPQAFTEGKIDFDVLRQLLGGSVDEREEKYGLNWFGKRKARQLALTPSTGTLRPCPEDSINWDSTQNIMIEGDNLEVLKLLQKSYAGKVKLIYIDPPYNTGKDFVYPDNYRDNINNYLQITGQISGGQKITTNSEANGRFHTDWLNMMYPRLKLARNLLQDDGAIFISLDDAESANIRMVLNEIFGEEMFIGVFPWRSRTAKADVPFGVSKDVEWVIAYGKTNFLAGREGERRYFKTDDYDDRWRLADLTTQRSKDERPNAYFTMVNPKTGEEYPPNPIRTWSITVDTFPEYYKKGKIVFPGDYDFLSIAKPAFRVFESEDKEKALKKHGTEEVRMSISTYLPEKEMGRTEHGSKEIRDLFGSPVFSFPKPTSLIKYFIENCTDKQSIVMDFFAGSGTTGHAVMAQNAADGGSRQYILVQLPEKLDPSVNEQRTAADFCDQLRKPRNIAELTKERLRRAAKKVNEENPSFVGDFGFRVFKLDTSNIQAWEVDRDNLPMTLENAVQHLKTNRSESDILYELLLKLGLKLSVFITTRTIVGKIIYSIGKGVLLVCLADQISREEAEPLALGIVEWHIELAPAGETTCVFRDSGFVDDVAKSNLTAILDQYGLANVRSL